MKFVYGMRLRGFAPLCQPKNGFVERRDSTTYHDLILYDRELTEKEMRDYDLDFAGMERETVKLEELCGGHVLQGIEHRNYTRLKYEEMITSDAVWFRLDGVTYLAVENPSDGYRSMCEDIEIVEDVPKIKIPDNPVVCYMKPDNDYTDNNTLVVRDAHNGKMVLEIGTDHCNDYYPVFVCNYYPENLSCNEGRIP